jgi:peptide/nickel transport system substrate-binding protein
LKIKLLFLSIFSIIFLTFSGCEKDAAIGDQRIVIGLASDVETLNPLYYFSLDEGVLSGMLYLGLFGHEWNSEKGELDIVPMLAEKWEWSEDSLSILIYLRDDVFWRDGTQLTAEDIVFTFDMYSDPDVESRLYGSFIKFHTNNVLHIDLEKTFDVEDQFKLKINFKENSNPSLFDIDYPIIPKHAFEKLDRKNLAVLEKGLDTVTSGPFYLSKRERNNFITFRANEKSFLNDPENINEIIFKIVPSYDSRLTQLGSGEIDFMDEINPSDAAALINNEMLNIEAVKGRFYDYAGWNNIDPVSYKTNQAVIPHKLFGNSEIRKALTLAINRTEILEEFLLGYGELAAGPIAPIFTNAYDDSLTPLSYDPVKAKEILLQQGWIDSNNDGIIEKNNNAFVFTLSIPSGNPRRQFAATVIKNNLRAVGIDVKVHQLEPGVFFDQLFKKEMDAWIVGWSVPIPPDLKPFWHSNLNENNFNVVSYQNKNADLILEKIEAVNSGEGKNYLIKEFQNILYQDNPVTFLYWIDNLAAYNKRINNVNINPLGSIQQTWKWKTSDN